MAEGLSTIIASWAVKKSLDLSVDVLVKELRTSKPATSVAVSRGIEEANDKLNIILSAPYKQAPHANARGEC
jgi:hypothetical protein